MHDDDLLGNEDAPRRHWSDWIVTALLWGGIVIALNVVLQRMG